MGRGTTAPASITCRWTSSCHPPLRPQTGAPASASCTACGLSWASWHEQRPDSAHQCWSSDQKTSRDARICANRLGEAERNGAGAAPQARAGPPAEDDDDNPELSSDGDGSPGPGPPQGDPAATAPVQEAPGAQSPCISGRSPGCALDSSLLPCMRILTDCQSSLVEGQESGKPSAHERQRRSK